MIETNPRPPPRPAQRRRTIARTAAARRRCALFAQQGFAKTSTREIAEAAGTNIAAISYYFGDKAGLYRAVFFEPQGRRPKRRSPASAAPS